MNPLLLHPVGAFVDVILVLVMTLFVISGILLIFVVLIQEGKGGGIAGAFGGAGAEAFGVKAGTVNRFTAYVGTAFLLLALLHAGISARKAKGDADFTSGSAITQEPPPPTAAPIPPADGSKPAGETPPGTPPESAPGGAPPAPPGPAPAPAPAPAPVPPAPAPAPGPAPIEPPPAMDR